MKKKDEIRKTLNLENTLKILDENTIEVLDKVIIDIGAIGKGFWVDKIFQT